MGQSEDPPLSFADDELLLEKRPRWRLIAVVLVVIIVGAVVAASLYQHPGTPSPTEPKSPYVVTVDKVSEYGNSTLIDHTFFLMVSASYGGASSWEFDPVKFRLVTNTSAIYFPSGSVYQGTPLGPAILHVGESVSGQLVFNLPSVLTPSRLNYTDTVRAVSIEVMVPKVSSWLSVPNLFPQVLVNQQPQPVNSLTINVTCYKCRPSSSGNYNFSGNIGTGLGHSIVMCARASCSWPLNRTNQIPWVASWNFLSNSLTGTMNATVTLDTGRVVFDQSTSTLNGVVSGSGSSYPSAFAVAILGQGNYLHAGYYSGETIRVQIAPGYDGGSFDPTSVKIVRITDTETGFVLSSTYPALPVTIQRSNSQFTPITVNLVAPSFSYSDTLHLTITIQPA